MFDQLTEEEMYVFVAPDGSIQVTTLATDFPTCVAITKVLAQAGLGKDPAVLLNEGFQILPVKVTITQNGTEQEGFTKAQADLKSGKLW